VWSITLGVPPAEWKEFAPSEGGFTVLLPEKPSQKGQADVKTSDGDKVREVSAGTAGAGVFSVRYYDLADKPINDYLYFNWLKNRLLSDKGGKLARENEVSPAVYPCKEFVVELPNDQLLVRRIYLAQARVFLVTAEGSRSPAAALETQKFFDSFKIKSVPNVPAELVASAVPKESLVPALPVPKKKADPAPVPKADPVPVPKVDPVPVPKVDPAPKPPVEPTVKKDPEPIAQVVKFPLSLEEKAVIDALNRHRLRQKAALLQPTEALCKAARLEAEGFVLKKPAQQTKFGYATVSRMTFPIEGAVSAQQFVDHLVSQKAVRAQLEDEDVQYVGVGIYTGENGMTYYMLILCGGVGKE
jgi:hypothetical protein